MGSPEPPDDASLKALVQEGGQDVPISTMSGLRRLVFESQTLMIQHVKSLVENKTEEKTELASAERAARISAQAVRLNGVPLRGESECSYSSYNLVMRMLQENTVSYLPPSHFASRTAELKAEKPKRELEVASSKILLREQEVDVRCQLTTALNLHHALHRRALALDLIGVATYSSVVAFNDFLMSQLQVEPPPGYASITVPQVLEADRAAWLRMAEKLPKGLRRTAAGELPMDSVLPSLESDPKVVFHLLPLPCKSVSSASARKQPDEASAPPPSKWQRTDKGKKGKGKQKFGKPPKSMPLN